jgi:hypothetical protein
LSKNHHVALIEVAKLSLGSKKNWSFAKEIIHNNSRRLNMSRLTSDEATPYGKKTQAVGTHFFERSLHTNA